MNTGIGPTLDCLVTYSKEQVMHVHKDVAIALSNTHINAHTVGGNHSIGGGKKRKKLTELKSKKGTSIDSWKSLQVLWSLYKTYTDVSEAERSLQLSQGGNKKLLVQILQANPNVTNKSELEQLTLSGDRLVI